MNINRKALLEVLGVLKPAVPARNSIEALTHVWFDKKHAYAHDGGLGIRVKFETPFEFGVPGGTFLSIVGQVSADSIDMTDDSNALTFKAGRSNVKLVTLPSDAQIWPYPEKPTGKPVATVKASEAFLQGLKRVFLIRPSNPQRMEHYAVSVFPFEKGKEMELYVTDSRVLAMAPVKEPVKGKVNALALPRGFAEQLVALAKDEPEVEVYGDHYRCQVNDATVIYSSFFDTTDILDLPGFVDRFCDEDAAPPFKFPEDMRPALERAVTMAGSEEPLVLIHVNGKKLKLTGKFKFGELSEEFDLDKSVTKCTVKANIRHLLAPKDTERMMIHKEGITLRGKDGFVYTLAVADGG